MKRQATYWEKIFINHISDKGLVYRIHKELLKLNKNAHTKIWTKDMNRHFTKEDIQMENKHMKYSQNHLSFSSVQFSSVAQLCPTLCDPHESQHARLQTTVHWVAKSWTWLSTHTLSTSDRDNHGGVSTSQNYCIRLLITAERVMVEKVQTWPHPSCQRGVNIVGGFSGRHMNTCAPNLSQKC